MSATLEEAIEEVRALPPDELEELRGLASNLGELLVIALVLAFIHKQGKSDRSEVRSLLERANSEMPALTKSSSRRALRGRAEIRQLAREQGVQPFSFDQERPNFWPEEESSDDFLMWLRSVRDEGGAPRRLPE